MERRSRAQSLPVQLDGGFEAWLRDESTIEEMLALTIRNQHRLRRWENWAHAEQTRESIAAFTRHLLAERALGRAIPVVLRRDGEAVGSASARRAGAGATAPVEIGFWVDGAVEGRGLATSASRALIELWRGEGARSFLIRTAADNPGARRVAEKLGFGFEGIRPAGFPVGGRMHDEARYTLEH